MLAEPIAISGKSLALPAQARSPDGGANVKAEKKPDSPSMTEMAAEVQNNLDMVQNLNLHFSVHGASGEIMVTVIDESSGKVIREIPPSETLNLAAKLDAMVGLLFDQKG